jgi:hypothetical protein
MKRGVEEITRCSGCWRGVALLKYLSLTAGAVVVLRLAACGGSDDTLASLDFLLAEESALCDAAVCTHGDDEVPTQPIYARALESREASRFAPEGLFVISSWESEERWVELEIDVPTDRVGYVDLDFRYAEFRDGEEIFSAEDSRGRIVLVEPLEGDLPFVGHFELRLESGDGQFRVIHRGHLNPDDEEAVSDPGPPGDEIDWDMEGIELVILESAPGATYEYTEPNPEDYRYDYRDRTDPYEELIDTGCDITASCASTYYYEEEDVEAVDSCSGDDVSGSGDVYYYDDTDTSGCSGSDSGSWCTGDSDDDIWDDDSDSSSCNSTSDDYYYYEGEETKSSCEGDDYDSGGFCSSDDGYDDYYGDSYSDDSSDKGCLGCESDDEYLAGARHRRELRMIAIGRRPPNPFRRGLSFTPVLFAFMVTQLMKRPKRT